MSIGHYVVRVPSNVPQNVLISLPSPPPDLLPLTSCQMEAAGIQPVQVPGFVPRCDERGLYKALQCFVRSCWCVDPVNGRKIPGAKCGTAVQPGGTELSA